MPPSVQCPSFWQGVDSHSSISTSHRPPPARSALASEVVCWLQRVGSRARSVVQANASELARRDSAGNTAAAGARVGSSSSVRCLLSAASSATKFAFVSRSAASSAAKLALFSRSSCKLRRNAAAPSSSSKSRRPVRPAHAPWEWCAAPDCARCLGGEGAFYLNNPTVFRTRALGGFHFRHIGQWTGDADHGEPE